jgi:hypothetical protein
MKTYKQVPSDMLRAFGFRKVNPRDSVYGIDHKDVWKNTRLCVWYSPHIHSQKMFADNICNAIAHETVKDLSSKWTESIPALRDK